MSCRGEVDKLDPTNLTVRTRVASAEESATLARKCPACESEHYSALPRYSNSQWTVGRCVGCGFVYLPQVLNYAVLNDEHAWEKSHADEATERKKKTIYRLDYATRFRLGLGKSRETNRMLKQFSPGPLLDVGCGAGVRAVPGTIPYGVEISQVLWQRSDADARSRGGYVVHGPALEGMQAFPDHFFKGIIMRSYLEHEIAPREVLQVAFAKLAPEGVLYVKVPNYGSVGRWVMGRHWCGFRLPDHVNYFTQQSLTSMAERLGFKCRKLNAFAALDDNIFTVMSKAA